MIVIQIHLMFHEFYAPCLSFDCVQARSHHIRDYLTCPTGLLAEAEAVFKHYTGYSTDRSDSLLLSGRGLVALLYDTGWVGSLKDVMPLLNAVVSCHC